MSRPFKEGDIVRITMPVRRGLVGTVVRLHRSESGRILSVVVQFPGWKQPCGMFSGEIEHVSAVDRLAHIEASGE